MKRIALALLVMLALAGCYSPGEKQGEASVYVWEDPNRPVTCYIYGDGGTYGKAISCLSDREIGQ